MTVTSPTTVVDNINKATNQGNTAAAKAQTNYQDFLKLLTTQLQNQDPSAPTDTNQLTQQIATLSQVEQQINTNTNLQKLVSLYSSSTANSVVGYIGKQVETDGNKGVVQGHVGSFVYNLDKAAKSVKVEIQDSAGITVLNADGTKLVGRNEMVWDGKDNSGKQLADGTYTIKVTALDDAGQPLTATTRTVGMVSSIDTSNGVTTLSLGDVQVDIDKIISVRQAIVAASAA